jgi:hypothetical protein
LRPLPEQARGAREIPLPQLPQPADAGVATETKDVGMTHEDLRKAAVRWLTNSKKCSVVLSEMVSAAGEIPDAIGWKYGFSYLVECKTSRSDFKRNEDKWFIRSGSGMGCNRFFLCPRGLIEAPELDGSGYGLLWIGESGHIRVIREPETKETNSRKEICMLTSALRRVRTREFLTINIVATEDEIPLEDCTNIRCPIGCPDSHCVDFT